jgi:hypothetical protein
MIQNPQPAADLHRRLKARAAKPSSTFDDYRGTSTSGYILHELGKALDHPTRLEGA